jgi:hypothetical protein
MTREMPFSLFLQFFMPCAGFALAHTGPLVPPQKMSRLLRLAPPLFYAAALAASLLFAPPSATPLFFFGHLFYLAEFWEAPLSMGKELWVSWLGLFLIFMHE